MTIHSTRSACTEWAARSERCSTGIFATNAVNHTPIDGKVVPPGLIDGNASQILNQGIGVLIAIALAMAGTFILLKVCDALIGVRVQAGAEQEGLDLSRHGEEGYFLEP